MILMLPGTRKKVWLKCGHHRTYVDADDFGSWARRCEDCKRWTQYTVKWSPKGTRIEVQVAFTDDPFKIAPVEPAATPLAAETFPGTGRRAWREPRPCRQHLGGGVRTEAAPKYGDDGVRGPGWCDSCDNWDQEAWSPVPGDPRWLCSICVHERKGDPS